MERQRSLRKMNPMPRPPLLGEVASSDSEDDGEVLLTGETSQALTRQLPSRGSQVFAAENGSFVAEMIYIEVVKKGHER